MQSSAARIALSRETELHRLRADYGSLSRREREVMAGGGIGLLLNKQVGTELGISEITVKAHRGNVMRKMKADSFAHFGKHGVEASRSSLFDHKCRLDQPIPFSIPIELFRPRSAARHALDAGRFSAAHFVVERMRS